MFDGVPDQFHQFIGGGASSPSPATATLLLPLPFTSSNGFTCFEPLFLQQQQPPQFLQALHQQKNNEDSTGLVAMNMEIDERDQRSMAEPIDNIHHQQHHPWSHDEVLALLRIRSSTETWFPEFTWEHVSRKLTELGFKRSAEKCKEKFEEESRYFNTINCSKNYRIFTELEELCQAESPPPPHQHHHNHHIHHQSRQREENEAVVADENNKNVEKPREEEEDNIGQNLEGGSRNADELYQTSPANNNTAMSSDQDKQNVVENKGNDDNKASSKKRKRMKKLEMFKGFCEEIVNKLMIQQEKSHNKLLEDMVKRDEEKVAREAAWKRQELDRINQELELRAKEQAIAGDRQATIIKFLTNFSQNGSSERKCSNPPLSASSSSLPVAENPNPIANGPNKVDQASTTTSATQTNQNPNPKTPTPQNPSSPLAVASKAPQNPTSNDKEDLGKRWPRDEVMALINLRCSLYNNGDHDKEEAAIKAPLWERISQGMLDLGYKRTTKHSVQSWNTYVTLVRRAGKPLSLPEDTTVQGDETSNIVQVPGLEFEF
ncbi:GT-2Like protein [Hibiscus trionum]|uniref:GT-2Like protein n=1 Tax=Hibiscus trionum TaxID=183268 RepID=A0A9W7GWA1_HIBTR|nr:GT-2Like protein [Hibiscus trionum]